MVKTRRAIFTDAAPTASSARRVARTPQHTTDTRVTVRDSRAHTSVSACTCGHTRVHSANFGVAARRARRTPGISAYATTVSRMTITAAALHTSNSGVTRRKSGRHIGCAPRYSTNSGRHSSGPHAHASISARHSTSSGCTGTNSGYTGTSSGYTGTNSTVTASKSSRHSAAPGLHGRGARVDASISTRRRTNSGCTTHGAVIQSGAAATHALQDRGHGLQTTRHCADPGVALPETDRKISASARAEPADVVLHAISAQRAVARTDPIPTAPCIAFAHPFPCLRTLGRQRVPCVPGSNDSALDRLAQTSGQWLPTTAGNGGDRGLLQRERPHGSCRRGGGRTTTSGERRVRVVTTPTAHGYEPRGIPGVLTSHPACASFVQR